MKGLLIAIQFLTRLPTPRITVSSAEFAASMRWFPAVGLIIGTLVAVAGWVGGQIDPWTGALFALLMWVAVTGALHLDGLGDIADAGGAAHKARGRLSAVEDRERLLAVLADPHVGSFAVVTIALQLIAKLVLLHALIDDQAFVAIALIPFAGRIGPLLWSRTMPDLHAGLGSRFRGAVRPLDLAIWGVLLLAAGWLSPSLLAAPLIFAFWGWWLVRRIGGISGDGHGAGIEIGESLLLAAALLLVHSG
ncbi:MULTISPECIES: adenosylcobinamide-GDP ribazoletransferase [unclassified Sphingopyxis]|jgi:adenosylcobinamide-GDP ribazoletransferase|uniref:adenosylcobinamide-GDP ribazoletransferase n=1 Tax=unclassified Sphingopyxis TaxID=2614943 RepID=UPI002854D0A9|nr:MULTISPECIES: adenosylcobinamide-GDP ribazoletransferase [unclassified Sphingopyxis]MDR6833684.1 adenosylcobinamide-GDP ribazoletransferase [Sphingopyxis sp. BE122]MDR7225953.1 adenosylcobinamide-GDP ribazoletransferase [Sphingopyxis sp. BE259]